MRNIDDLIQIYQGFSVAGTDPIDNRLVVTQADLDELGMHESDPDSQYNLGKWPEHYFFLLEDDGQIYEFWKSPDPVDPAKEIANWAKRTFLIDNKTIDEFYDSADSKFKLHVPIDGVSIIYDSADQKVKATAKPLASSDGHATHLVETSEGFKVNVLHDKTLTTINNELHVNVDGQTIKVTSEGKLYTVPEPLTAGDAIKIEPGTGAWDLEKIGVRVDSESIIVNGNNDLAVKLGVALALNNGISVLYDDRSVVLDSEGKLSVPFDKETIQSYVHPDTGKLVWGVPYYNGLGHDGDALIVNYDNKTIGLNDPDWYEGELSVRHDKTLEERYDAGVGGTALGVNVDNYTIYIAEGSGELKSKIKYRDALKLDDSDPSIPYVDVLYDNKSIKLDSEGKLSAVPEPLFDGHATKVNPKTSAYDSESIDVLHDATLKLVAGNKLRVNIDEKTLRDSSGELYVAVDNDSIFFDSSEGVLKAKAVAVNAGHAMEITGNVLDVLFDNKTIKEAGDKKLYIPIDEKSLVISEGKLVLNMDKDTVYFDTSEQKVKAKQMHIDEKTIVWHNDVEDSYIETRIGGWAEQQQAYVVVNDPNATYSGDKRELYYDLSADFNKLQLNDRLTISYMLYDGSSDTTEAIYHQKGTVDCIECYIGDVKVEGKIDAGKWVFTRIDGTAEFPSTWTGGAGNSPFNMKIESPSGVFHYDPIDGNFIPVDGDTIVLNASGQLRAVAKDLIAGEAININPADFNSINVKYDNKTIVLDSEGKLEAVNELPPYSSSEEDKFLRVASDGSLEWAPAGKVDDVLFDGVTVVGADKVARFVKATDSEFGLVKFDNEKIVVDSEGRLTLGHRYVEDVLLYDSEGHRSIVDSENKVDLDLRPYSLVDETARSIQIFMDEHIASEGSEGSEGSTYKITIKLYDKNGQVISTSNVLDLPIESTVVDGHVEIESEVSYLVLTLHNGKQVRIPMSAIIGGFIDTRSDYVGTNSIYGTKNFAGELQNYGVEVITQVQVDNKTILWNDSEVYLEAILPEGRKAIELVDLGASYVYDVKYDEETILRNSANELYVPLDKKTIVISEGKLAVNLDHETIIYDDSEKVVKLPIDKVTIRINSEGLLEASGLDVLAGDAIEIENSEHSGLPVKMLNVLFDKQTIDLNSEGKLEVLIDKDSIIINSEGKLEVDQYTVSEIRALWHAVCVEGEA